ncbi:MAG: hypothetical protein ACI3Z0_07270 [Candidatus Cryptobacteroides sp.]
MKISRYIALMLGALLLCGCDINDFKQFTDYYMAFDTSKSSTTTVNEAGEFAGSYNIHFCTVKRDEAVTVTVEVIPGDGLCENVDYKVVTSSSIKFAPGVYDKTFVIQWLPHVLDASKDNTLTLRLFDCSDPSVTLGVPGPDEGFRSLKIYKTK